MDPTQHNFSGLCSSTDSSHQLTSSIELRFPLHVTILVYIAYFIPFCFGVFGNVSVCLIFFKQKKLRSITNTFLMNLCLNDLIVLCVSIPMTLSAALLENWVFGAFLCKLVHFTPTVTALVSTFTVAVIAVERWFFIVNRHKFHRRCTIVALVLLWAISIVIASPEMLSRQMKDTAQMAFEQGMLNHARSFWNKTTGDLPSLKLPCPIKRISYCYSQPTKWTRIFSYLVLTVQYVVPFLFVSVSCYSISRFLRRRMILMRSYQTHNRPSQHLKRSSRQKSMIPTEETTEQDGTSHDDLSSPDLIDDNQGKGLLTCFRQPFKTQEQVNEQPRALNLVDQQQMLRTQSHSKRRFHRSRKLLIYVAALFTISWLPLTIAQIYIEHHHDWIYKNFGHNFIYGYLLIPCYLVSSLSAWVNPVIYNYINRSFRREFYSLYSCCFEAASSRTRGDFTTVSMRRSRPDASPTDRTDSLRAARLASKATNQGVSFAKEMVVVMDGPM